MRKNISSYKEILEKNIDIRSDEDCWFWKGDKKNGSPYMSYYSNPKKLMYLLYISKEIPKGMSVSSTCGNRICLNPKHLWVSPFRNTTRRSFKQSYSWRN